MKIVRVFDARPFCSPHRRVGLSPKRQGHLKRVSTAAGLPARRRDLFHKIRKTSGTAVFVAAGGSLSAAQEHLGQSNPATTLAYVDPTQTETDNVKRLTDLRQ